MVIYPVCGATKALIRLNANHMGQQVELPSRVVQTHTHAHTHIQCTFGGVRKSTGKRAKHQILCCRLLFAFNAWKKFEALPGVNDIILRHPNTS